MRACIEHTHMHTIYTIPLPAIGEEFRFQTQFFGGSCCALFCWQSRVFFMYAVGKSHIIHHACSSDRESQLPVFDCLHIQGQVRVCRCITAPGRIRLTVRSLGETDPFPQLGLGRGIQLTHIPLASSLSERHHGLAREGCIIVRSNRRGRGRPGVPVHLPY